MAETILGIYFTALTLLLLFGIHRLVLVWRYMRMQPQDPVRPAAGDPAHLPHVTIQLPVYNEYFVVERLIDAACGVNYPRQLLQIQVLDDSTDDSQSVAAQAVERWRAKGFDIVHVLRQGRPGYKAGALKHGLQTATGDFVAVFDADFLPTPDFLIQTIPYLLQDADLGMVQARWAHINENYSLLTRMQAMALDAHFAVEQQVNNRSGLFINFNGTAGVWRRQCILQAGDWQSDTLTEDLDLSYRAQLLGWRFLYLNDVSVPSELPSDIASLKSQQFRWTKGTIQTARKHLKSLWRSALSFRVKLNATVHLLSNFVFPLILLVATLNIPIVWLKIFRPDYLIVFNIMGVFLLASVASFVYCLTAQRDLHSNWRERMMLFPVYLAGTMGLAVSNTRAVLEAVLKRPSAFIRTPKLALKGRSDTGLADKRRRYRDKTGMLVTGVELLLAVYFLVAVGVSVRYAEVSMIPFQLMFLFGFGASGLMSLRHRWAR